VPVTPGINSERDDLIQINIEFGDADVVHVAGLIYAGFINVEMDEAI
jgi:hypothetical protein